MQVHFDFEVFLQYPKYLLNASRFLPYFIAPAFVFFLFLRYFCLVPAKRFHGQDLSLAPLPLLSQIFQYSLDYVMFGRVNRFTLARSVQ